MSTGDEESGTIGVTGNNHIPIEEDNHVESTPAPSGETGHKKEKSVLQAKLTKLAIQVRNLAR